MIKFIILLCCIAAACGTPVLLAADTNEVDPIADVDGTDQVLTRKTRGVTIGFGGVSPGIYPGYGYPAYAYPPAAYSYGYSYPVYAAGYAHFGGGGWGGWGHRGWGGGWGRHGYRRF